MAGDIFNKSEHRAFSHAAFIAQIAPMNMPEVVIFQKIKQIFSSRGIKRLASGSSLRALVQCVYNAKEGHFGGREIGIIEIVILTTINNLAQINDPLQIIR